MYKIFVGDKPIILTTKVEKETNFKNYLLDTVNIGKVIREIKQSHIEAIHLIDSDKDVLIEKFLKLLPNVVAGGGKVFNDHGEVLFIFRNNKWDLPKGHLKKGERPEFGGMREVEEECGISELNIVKHLANTFHMYDRKGLVLKKTFW